MMMLAITVATCFIFYVLYNEAKKTCSDELYDSFMETILQEKEKRMDREHLFFSYRRSYIPSRHILIQRENETILLNKSDSIKNMIFHEKQHHADQSFLFLDDKEVNIYDLDSIWHADLLARQLPLQTAVTYQNNMNHAIYHSRNDSLIDIPTWHTEPITLGLRGEITLQGFAWLMPAHVIRKDVKRFAMAFVAWILITGMLLIFIFYQKNKIHALVPNSGAIDIATRHPDQIVEHILLNASKYLIIYRNAEFQLTQQLFQLFQLLWNKPDHYASYQELALLLFGSGEMEKTENRLAKAVNRLRKSLQGIPELTIENIPHQGYHLQWKEEDL